MIVSYWEYTSRTWLRRDIRACGMERKVANCAHCAGYATCGKLARFVGSVPAARATLDEIRRGL